MSEAHCDLFAEFYRRRTKSEKEKIKRELDPYLKEIGKDEK